MTLSLKVVESDGFENEYVVNANSQFYVLCDIFSLPSGMIPDAADAPRRVRAFTRPSEESCPRGEKLAERLRSKFVPRIMFLCSP